ncbi:MAG: hypothetical protein NTZ09_08520 [Candidatus Hydrogenedentes bacterium]|nr:hypothetical protein [Candidatus Hydrogenedentota bacterium]
MLFDPLDALFEMLHHLFAGELADRSGPDGKHDIAPATEHIVHPGFPVVFDFPPVGEPVPADDVDDTQAVWRAGGGEDVHDEADAVGFLVDDVFDLFVGLFLGECDPKNQQQTNKNSKPCFHNPLLFTL